MLPRSLCFSLLAALILGYLVSTSNSARSDSVSASLHFSRALREAKCKDPMPRVVHVGDLYPNSRKKYLPHCTVLYHCSQDTGCCSREDQICGPKTIERVELAFWTVELTRDGQRKGVQTLLFDNHTECECKTVSFRNPYGVDLLNSALSEENLPSEIFTLRKPPGRGSETMSGRSYNGVKGHSPSTKSHMYYSYGGQTLYNYDIPLSTIRYNYIH